MNEQQEPVSQDQQTSVKTDEQVGWEELYGLLMIIQKTERKDIRLVGRVRNVCQVDLKMESRGKQVFREPRDSHSTSQQVSTRIESPASSAPSPTTNP